MLGEAEVAPYSWLAKQANQRGQVLSPVKGPHVVEGPSRWLSVCRVCCPSLQTSDLHMCTVVCVCPHMHAHTYRINKRKCFNVLESSKRCPMPTSGLHMHIHKWGHLQTHLVIVIKLKTMNKYIHKVDIQGAWVNAIGFRINLGWLSVVLLDCWIAHWSLASLSITSTCGSSRLSPTFPLP